jgi:membrane protein YdbS with pleckstrin-like domain
VASLENARLRAPAHHVSPRARWYWATRAAGGWLILLGAEAAALFAVGITPMAITLVITALIGLAHLIVMPQWRYRVHTWEDAGGAVYTQTGWITQERRIAPVNRIQTVDTHRGPIEQLFRLSNITVTTASAAGPLRIHGLDRRTADQLVATLTQRTQATEDDAT